MGITNNSQKWPITAGTPAITFLLVLLMNYEQLVGVMVMVMVVVVTRGMGHQVVGVLSVIQSWSTKLDGGTCNPPSKQLPCCPSWLGGTAAIVHCCGALGQTKPVSREFSVMWHVYGCV